MFIHRQIKLGVSQAAEQRQIKEKMAEAKYGLGQVSLESGKCPKRSPKRNKTSLDTRQIRL